MKRALFALLPLLLFVLAGSTAGGATLAFGNRTRIAALTCPTDTTQADFQAGVPTNVDLTASPGDVILLRTANLDQQNTLVATNHSFDSTSWFGQTFTPGATGQLTQVDVDLLCNGCTGTTPDLTVSIRAVSGNVPSGADLATATIPGFSSGSASFYSATFATPPTLTAGTQYALVVRAVSNPSAGTYQYPLSSTPSAYARRSATSTNSGVTWSAASPPVDIGFKTYMNTFVPSGDLISSVKDSNQMVGFTTHWSTLSFTASTPANTTLRFQVAASNSPSGPFNFVGPDATAATFFTTSGASLSQFDGNRYLEYRAYLSTTDNAVTPTLNDVTVCYTLTGAPDLSLTKSDGGASVAPGGTVAYTLTYANSGTGDATGVVLTETVPANTTFNSGASTAGWVCTPDNNAGSTCTLAVGTVTAGGGNQTATFAVTVVNPVAAGVSQIANTASIADDGAHGADPTPGDNAGSDTTPVMNGFYYSVTPCRLADTRNPAGPYGGPAINALSTRTFVAAGQCGVPAGAMALAFNLTVTLATAQGDLRFYSTGIPTPLVAVVSYSANQTRSNNGIVGLGAGGDFVVRSDQPTGTVQLIVDVTGYFR